MANVGSFSFLGIKDFIVRDRITKEVKANLKHLVNISLSDETSTDFLRGGYGSPKLLTLFGERDTKLEGSTATVSEDLIAIMTNSETISKTKPVPIVEDLDIQGGKFTLTDTPSTGVTPTVYKLDPVTGMELVKLTAGSPSTNQNDYSLSGKILTAHSSVTKIRIYYDADKTVQSIEVKDVTPKSYEMIGLLVAKSIETGKLYKAALEIPKHVGK